MRKLPQCPECKSDNIEETTLGTISGPDRNRAWCHDCGWAGARVEAYGEPIPEELDRLARAEVAR